MYCSHCGKQIDDGVSFCPECGAKVGAPADQPKQDAPRVYCKNCGREVSPDVALCPNCGAKGALPQLRRQDRTAEQKADQRFGHCGLCALPHLAVGRLRLRCAHRRAHSECHRRCAARKVLIERFCNGGARHQHRHARISIVTLVFWALMVALIVTGVVTGFFDAFFDAVYPSEIAAL